MKHSPRAAPGGTASGLVGAYGEGEREGGLSQSLEVDKEDNLFTLTLNNLGVLFCRAERYEDALSYLLRTLELEVEGRFHKEQVATSCLNVTTVLSSKKQALTKQELDRHEEAIQNCSQAISLLDTLIAESESPSEPVRWKLAVALNNLGVEHQYLRK